MKFEDMLMGFTEVFDGRAMDYRNVLQLSLSPSGLQEKETHMRRSDWPMLLSIVSAYRLAEVISINQGIHFPPRFHRVVERRTRTSAGLDVSVQKLYHRRIS